jgi:hypothetical protein
VIATCQRHEPRARDARGEPSALIKGYAGIVAGVYYKGRDGNLG